MAMSSRQPSRPFLRLRPVRLITADEFKQKIDQRRRESLVNELNYRRQVTGKFWSYASGVHRATGSHSALLPPFTLDELSSLPTQEMNAVGARTTDKIAAYHEPCSDEFSIEDLRIPLEIQEKLEISMQEHGGRYPNVIRLNPFIIELLKLMHECNIDKKGIPRYKGLIPLEPDSKLILNDAGIDYP